VGVASEDVENDTLIVSRGGEWAEIFISKKFPSRLESLGTVVSQKRFSVLA